LAEGSRSQIGAAQHLCPQHRPGHYAALSTTMDLAIAESGLLPVVELSWDGVAPFGGRHW
jgi:hypothetical protein